MVVTNSGTEIHKHVTTDNNFKKFLKFEVFKHEEFGVVEIFDSVFTFLGCNSVDSLVELCTSLVKQILKAPIWRHSFLKCFAQFVKKNLASLFASTHNICVSSGISVTMIPASFAICGIRFIPVFDSLLYMRVTS